MAATKGTQDKDVIARLADKGEETLRRIVDAPRKVAGDMRHGVDALCHDVASKLRSIDPLDGRVAELERRLESLEKPAKKATRRTARPKAATTRRAGPVAVTAADDAAKDTAPAAGETEPTR